MLSYRGPVGGRFPTLSRLPPVVAGTLLVLALASAVPVAPARAQQQIPLTLAAAEDLALAEEPGREALLARAGALTDQAAAAAELPDPSLRVGLANFPLESGGFSTEGMTQGQLGLRQVFPPGRSREVAARRFGLLADELAGSADVRRRDVRLAVRNAWLEARYWSDARGIVRQSRPHFRDLVTVTRSLYAVGRKDQQDVLRAELELSRLDDRLLDIDRRLAAARAALSEWTGEAASRPLAAAGPGWQQLPPREQLHQALREHPAVVAADARIGAERAAVDLEKERDKPGWALDLGYGYRDGLLPDGAPRSDFVSVSVTVDLPFLRPGRHDRSIAAALGERRAAEAERTRLLRRLGARLDSEYARWQELGRRLDLFDQRILNQAEDRARAALSAYQSEAGDFADVMRGHIDELDTELQYRRLTLERAQSYAVLANLGGIAP